MVVFLIGVMKSRASWAREGEKASPIKASLSATGTDGRPLHDPPDQTRNAEDWQLAGEDAAARLKALEEIFADDEPALLFVMATLEEMSKEEIKNMLNLTDIDYATVRRRIRRKIDQRFPHGWPA